MAISGTTTDYTNRTLDIHISGDLAPLTVGAQAVAYAFGNPSQYVAGIQKLVQRYLISLVNSGFIEKLLGMSASNISAAATTFNAANWQIIQQFRKYQAAYPSPNLDEQLNTVSLVSMTSDGDSVTISLKLISLAGNTVMYTLPLPL